MSHPIPKTVNEILEEFDRLEKTGINNERKTGLRCALNSNSIKRAHDKCIVLMSGESFKTLKANEKIKTLKANFFKVA